MYISCCSGVRIMNWLNNWISDNRLKTRFAEIILPFWLIFMAVFKEAYWMESIQFCTNNDTVNLWDDGISQKISINETIVFMQIRYPPDAQPFSAWFYCILDGVVNILQTWVKMIHCVLFTFLKFGDNPNASHRWFDFYVTKTFKELTFKERFDCQTERTK